MKLVMPQLGGIAAVHTKLTTTALGAALLPLLYKHLRRCFIRRIKARGDSAEPWRSLWPHTPDLVLLHAALSEGPLFLTITETYSLWSDATNRTLKLSAPRPSFQFSLIVALCLLL